MSDLPGLITRQEEFNSLCGRIREAGCFAMDLEFVREKTYFPTICLIQISTGGVEALADPQAGLNLSPLRELLADPEICTIVHAGGQDLELLAEGENHRPQGIFDTQIAASFLGMGDAIGYAELCRRMMGVSLRKTGQVADWERRPLPAKLLRYAILDVKHLPHLHERLVEILKKEGRLDWAGEEFDRLEEKSIAVPQEAWRRVKGGGSLEGNDLAVLATLAEWREQEARRRNQPRQRILNDRTMIELARQAPKRREALRVSRFFSSDKVKRYGEQILRAVQDGLALPPHRRPRKSRRSDKPSVPPPTLDLLNVFVKYRSDMVGIGPARLATRDDVAQLAIAVTQNPQLSSGASASDESAPRLLRGWRWDCVGKELVSLLQGKLSLRVNNRRLEVHPVDPKPTRRHKSTS